LYWYQAHRLIKKKTKIIIPTQWAFRIRARASFDYAQEDN